MNPSPDKASAVRASLDPPPPPDSIWNVSPEAALAEVERRLAITGHLWTSTGYFRALDRLPASIATMTSDYVDLRATAVADIAPLEACPHITTLHLGPQTRDIAVLAALPNIAELSFDVSAFDTLGGLAALPALQGLELRGYRGQPLPQGCKAQRLNVQVRGGEPRPACDAAALESWPRLAHVAIQADVGASWPALPSLAFLQIHGCDQQGFDRLAESTALEYVAATDCPITRIDALAACTSLTEVSLSGCPAADLSPLAALSALRRVSLTNSCVVDLGPLSRHPSLEWLSIDTAPLRSLSDWTPGERLRGLSLFDTQIDSIRPLAGARLTSLWLDGSPIADLTGLTDMPDLAALSIRATQVADLGEIARHPRLLGEEPDAYDWRERGRVGIYFSETPATAADPELARIAAMEAPQAALRAHLGVTTRPRPPASASKKRRGFWRLLWSR